LPGPGHAGGRRLRTAEPLAHGVCACAQAEPVVRDVTENTLKPMARDAAPKIEDAAQRFTQEVLQPAAKELAAKLEPGAQARHAALPVDFLLLPATCVGIGNQPHVLV